MSLFGKRKLLAPIALTPLMAWVLFPVVVMLLTSLKSPQDTAVGADRWLPSTWRFDNFIEVWRRTPLARYLVYSCLIASGATVAAVLVALPAAYALARLRFPGRRPVLFALLTTQMFSPVVVIIGLTQTMNMLQLGETYAGLILVYAAFNLAFAVWMLMGYFTTLPTELDEAAMIDGCSRWRVVTRILLPLARPGVVTVVVFVFIAAWNEFVVALAFTSGKPICPLSVGILDFFQQYEILWHYLMAAALIATVPVVVLFLAVEKQLVRGLTAGAIR